MSPIRTGFRVPCKSVRLFTPMWQRRGSIEASVCLSCFGCVGQQVSEGTRSASLLCQHLGFSPVRVNVKWLQPICRCVGEFASMRGYTVCVRVHVCVVGLGNTSVNSLGCVLDWQSYITHNKLINIHISENRLTWKSVVETSWINLLNYKILACTSTLLHLFNSCSFQLVCKLRFCIKNIG